jgi:crotonobetainyl-CoA:carnitine CoA-transferase CaiB-like acyl-CoA transferase
VTAATSPASALAGLRVVELGRGIAVPLAARWLADLGADVVKVEPPGGDPQRCTISNGPDAEVARALFDYLNAGKRSVIAPTPDSLVIRDIVSRADLLLEDAGPGRLEQLGMSPEDLRRDSPLLCVVRLSPFGQTGPDATRPASGLILQAVGGSVKSRGWPASEPVQIGGQFEEYAAAAYTATAALTVLAGAGRSGVGFDADVSRAECVHATLTFPTVTRTILETLGRGTSMEPLLGVKRCADGWVGVNVLTQQHWADLCSLVKLPEYITERERLRQGGDDRALFERQVEQWTRSHRVEEIVNTCQQLRIPATPVHDGETALRAS